MDNVLVLSDDGKTIEGVKDKTVVVITIPEGINTIGRDAFEGCTGLTSIDIPNSVISIRDGAFFGCTGLTSIDIPNSVISIGRTSRGCGAFEGCTGLTSVDIPDSVISIGHKTFSGCTGLTSVDIPNSVTSIGYGAFDNTLWYDNQPDGLVYAGKVAYKYKGAMPENTSIVLKDGTRGICRSAFEGCTGLTSINIPNSVTSIGDGAFRDCTGLTSINIPNSVTNIRNSAFSGCTGLTSIKVEDDNPKYNSRNNCNAIVETATNELIAGCQNTIIPNNVTSIGYSAFEGCTGLTSINIPNSVTSICRSAFFGCIGLTSIKVEDDNPKYDSRNNCNAIVETVTNELIAGCQNTIIPNSVTSIGDEAFRGCTGLTSIVIPKSVASIGGGAFSGCTGLTSIDIPNSVISIGNFFSGAFVGCTVLTTINIPNSVTSIGFETFAECTGLTSINIPNSVTSIGGGAFYSCTGLTFIDIPNSVTTIGEGAFKGCTGLISVDIPNSVTSIGGGAFRDCTGLTSINIPNSVTNIRNSAFSGCTGLTSINIPNSVTSIGNSAFYECTSLKNIDIPDSVTIIDNFAFCGSGLEKVTIPSCVNIIGKHAFCNTLINEFVVKEDNKTYFATDGVLFERSIANRLQNSILHAIKYFQGTNNDNSLYDSIDDESKSSTLLKYPPEKNQAKYVVNDDTTSLGCCAFKGAQYLEKIIMHNKLCSFGDAQTFVLCISLKEIHIPPKIECIPSACFSGCKALESVYVCDRERLQIEKKAFERCISIKGLYFRMKITENITVAADAFDEETYNNCVLYIPSGTRWAYRHHPILGKFSNIEIEK